MALADSCAETGPDYETGFSGNSGSTKVCLYPPGRDAFLYYVHAEEKSDVPCYLSAKFNGDLNDYEFKGCGGSSKDSESLSTGGDPVVGIRLCVRDNERMKGLQLIAEPDSSSDYFERNRCPGDHTGPDSDWESAVMCDPGHIATGLILNLNDTEGKDSISGMALRCHRKSNSETNSQKQIVQKEQFRNVQFRSLEITGFTPDSPFMRGTVEFPSDVHSADAAIKGVSMVNDERRKAKKIDMKITDVSLNGREVTVEGKLKFKGGSNNKNQIVKGIMEVLVIAELE